MRWSGERTLAVDAEAAASRLRAPGSGWLLPFLQLAAGPAPAGSSEPRRGGAHWYRLGPPDEEGGAPLVWRPPPHPSRFRRFRGRLSIRPGPPAVLVLTGTTDDGVDGPDAQVLAQLLAVLADAFDGLADDARTTGNGQADG